MWFVCLVAAVGWGATQHELKAFKVCWVMTQPSLSIQG